MTTVSSSSELLPSFAKKTPPVSWDNVSLLAVNPMQSANYIQKPGLECYVLSFLLSILHLQLEGDVVVFDRRDICLWTQQGIWRIPECCRRIPHQKMVHGLCSALFNAVATVVIDCESYVTFKIVAASVEKILSFGKWHRIAFCL